MTATLRPDESSARLAELNALGFQLFQEKLYPQALEVLQQVVDLTGTQRGPADPDLGVALLNRGRVFRLLERNTECEADYRTALDILRPRADTHQGQVIWLLKNLGALYRNTGRHGEAEPIIRELLEVQRATLPPGDPQLADLLVDLGAVCYQRGAVPDAVGFLGEALAIREKAFGADHPKTTELRQLLASLHAPSGSSASAPAAGGSSADAAQEQFNHCIIGFLQGHYADTSQRAMALIRAGGVSHSLLQVLLISLQRSGQTQVLAQVAAQVPEIARNVPWERTLLDLTLGNADPNAALSQAQDDEQRGEVFYYTAERLITIGNRERATELLSRAVALLPKGFCRTLAAARLSAQPAAPAARGPASAPADVEQRVSTLNQEANHLFQQGRTREALALFERISAVRRESAGEHDPVYAATLYDLGAVHLTLGDLDAAESHYRRALAIQEATLGTAHARTRATRKELAGVLGARGDLDAAAVLYRAVLAEEKSLGAHQTPEWVETSVMLSRLYTARNDHPAAQAMLIDALQVSRGVHGPQAATTVGVLARLVALLLEGRRFADANAFCVELLNARRATADTQPSDLADALDSMAQVAAALGDPARAEVLWQEALTISSKTR